MKLFELVHGLKIKLKQKFKQIDIQGIAYNSLHVRNQSLFIAIQGYSTDGHKYIKKAIEQGASCIAVENKKLIKAYPLKVRNGYIHYFKKKIPFIIYPNNRILLSKVSANFYKHPSKELNVIGITGTNGKTTITYLIEKILQENGYKTGVMGTINYRIGKKEIPASHTTPESSDVHSLMREMVQQRVDYVIMEVSSHSLVLNRVDDIHFNSVVFTNLTEDHFDFHKNFANYFKAKKQLLDLLVISEKKRKMGYINIDDGYGKKLKQEYGTKKGIKIFTYSLQHPSDFKAENISISIDETKFSISIKGNEYEIHSPLIGEHNVYNILCALGIGINENCKIKKILKAIKKLKGITGRLEILKIKNFYVGIDYAHTDKALENVLLAIQKLNPGKVITLFGCGGNRDPFKRPLMGKVASRYSNIVILTSDNPRFEEPKKIMEEIEKGMDSQTPYYKIMDRYDAIKQGLTLAHKDDFLLIAGKGHETYQIIKDQKFHFNDKEVVLKLAGE